MMENGSKGKADHNFVAATLGQVGYEMSSFTDEV